jgi:chromosome segregation ATPase
LNGHKIYDDTTRTNRSALFETCAKIEIRSGSKSFFDARNTTTTQRAALPCDCSKIERLTMIEIRQIVDDIRQAERELSTVANKRQVAVSEVEKTAQAVQEISDKLERLHLSERTLSETGQRLHAMASRALSRGLLQAEIQDGLQPLALKAQIQVAMNLVISSLDEATKASLTLQRLASEAREELKAVEAEFAQAEDKLEALRDDLRILQAEPSV